MNVAPPFLLVGAVAAVGVFHTMVPDHWLPITLIARQRGWTSKETARASLQAGTGHVLSTLAIALVVWLAGIAVAARFGTFVDRASGVALIAFGGWIAFGAWRELRSGVGHTHGPSPDGIHGPEHQVVHLGAASAKLSIFEEGIPPHFRLTDAQAEKITVETRRPDGTRQVFLMAYVGPYWESEDAIPEPHEFSVRVTVEYAGATQRDEVYFAEHSHGDSGGTHSHAVPLGAGPAAAKDPLYSPLRGNSNVLTHAHAHQHGRGGPHAHWHDHTAETIHTISLALEANPPAHMHQHKTSGRTALLLVLGSSPMVEGIPAFFAASRYGVGLLIVMSIVFAASTIATYVALCVYSAAGMQRIRLGPLERYGEVLSGVFIAVVGLVFLVQGLVS